MNFIRTKIRIATFAIALGTLLGPADSSSAKQSGQKSYKKFAKKSSRSKRKVNYTKAIKDLEYKLKTKKISTKKAWALTTKLESLTKKMSRSDRQSLYTLQAKLLRSGKYKILSGIYSAKAISSSKQKYAKSLAYPWANLKSISKSHPIQNFLTHLADNVGVRDDLPPGWNEDWNYIVALNMANKGKLLEAVREFKKLTPDNRNYFPASYRKAILLNQYSKNNAAVRELKNFLLKGFLDRAPLRSSEKKNLRNLAALALGRIYYEKEDFARSIFFYRQVDKDSLQYYDALFEQSWSLFMHGNPNHALGSLYSLQTPFFDEKYNPESSILKAIIYFWICHYDKSRNALADFLEKHQHTSKVITRFANNKSLTPSLAFKVFEARINGQKVKEIPSDVLAYVIDQPTLYSSRDQLAAVVEEKQRLSKKGIFGSKKYSKPLHSKLDTWIKSLKKEIGNQVIAELKLLSNKFTEHMKQAKFLYIELLMSETKKELGKNLHESDVENIEDQTYQPLIGWSGSKNMSWASSSKNEVWWDEIGYHIANEESKCAE
jgi:hypothetical protein